jgi:hypothetical protein
MECWADGVVSQPHGSKFRLQARPGWISCAKLFECGVIDMEGDFAAEKTDGTFSGDFTHIRVLEHGHFDDVLAVLEG